MKKIGIVVKAQQEAMDKAVGNFEFQGDVKLGVIATEHGEFWRCLTDGFSYWYAYGSVFSFVFLLYSQGTDKHTGAVL